MHINGCHIVSKLDKDSEEGFSSIVSRTLVTVEKDKDGKDVSSTESIVSQGPFSTVAAAVKYAHSWNDAANPPAIPVETVPEVEKSPEVPATPQETPQVVVNPTVPEQVATVHEAS